MDFRLPSLSVGFGVGYGCLRRLSRECLLAGMLGITVPTVMADTSMGGDGSIAARFPAGSITSTDLADRALADIDSERSALERRYTAEEQACYGRFFASNCLDTAKERRRASLAQLRPIEVEAKLFKRRAQVAERDEVLRAKQASADQPPFTSATRTIPADTKERGVAAGPEDRAPVSVGNVSISARMARHNAKLKRAQQEEEADAKKRVESAAAYQRKREESQARQRELDSKKQEKAREREAKQASGPG